MQQGEMLYEGKAKQVFLTDDPDMILIHYKDAATAFNNIKKATIENKGVLNNRISTLIFEYLNKQGIKTHYVKTLNDRDQLCRRVRIIPLEVIVRNVIAGSMAQRLGIEEGTKPSNVIFDICYKNDELGDPLINDHHAVALGVVTYDELKQIYAMTARINEVLKELFAKMNINLIDFKIEFGRTSDGEIVLADEVSPDTCRLWDAKTHEKLDKDRFRRDLGGVEDAYAEIMKRLLDQGVNIAFDTIGKCNYQPDVSRADWLSRLCAEGYDTQIVMSMDITRRSNFADRGGVGYSYLLDTFAPLASEAGVPDRAWENLLYRNALRIYKGQK